MRTLAPRPIVGQDRAGPWKGPAYHYIRESDRLPSTAEAIEQADPLLRVKLFGGPGTWWIAGFDPETRIAYGVAEIQEREVGDFDLDEIVELRIKPWGLPVERDLHWRPTRLSVVLEGLRR